MKFVIYLSKCCFNPLWLSSICHHSLYGTKYTLYGECAWVSQYVWCMCFREGNGSWAAEDPVSTEECKESSWEEERSRSGSEDCSQSSSGLLMSCLHGEKLVTQVMAEGSLVWVGSEVSLGASLVGGKGDRVHRAQRSGGPMIAWPPGHLHSISEQIAEMMWPPSPF